MAALSEWDWDARSVLRTTLIVLGVALAVYVTYLLRKPISWLVIAAFIAIARLRPGRRSSAGTCRGASRSRRSTRCSSRSRSSSPGS